MATSNVLLPVLAATPDPTNPPGLAFSTAGRPYLLFDDATDELCTWTFAVPGNYSGATAPVLKILYSMATGTSPDTIIMEAEVMGVVDGADLDTDAWDTANASAATTVPATTPGLQDTLSITLTNDGSPSALAADSYCAIRLRRDSGGGTASPGDVEVWALSFEYTTT